jgi:3-dehydroquinate synthase
MEINTIETGNVVTLEHYGAINEYVSNLNPTKIAVLVDDNTLQYCLHHFSENFEHTFELIRIPSGEEYKNLESCEYIWNELLHIGMDRSSILINLGGGVVCDMGGFCAATYMRGIKFIHVPTSLLAQVDAAIGGKQGIDLGIYKNTVGIIKLPEYIVIDTEFLETLPYKQLLSGFAEVLKYGLVYDRNIWDEYSILPDFRSAEMNEVVSVCAAIKTKIAEEDLYETGQRKILNFGHTIGHAIESYGLSKADPLLHGEAVAIGMVVEAHLSTIYCGLSTEEYKVIKNRILYLFGRKYKSVADTTALIENMKADKKNKRGMFQFSLLSGIGACKTGIAVSEEDIIISLHDYCREDD